MKVIVIEPGKLAEVRDIPCEDSTQSYEAVREIIGGYLEVLPISDIADAYIDEEAKCRDDKEPVFNELGDKVVKRFLAKTERMMIPGDVICNPLVIIGNRNAEDEFDGEWYDVPQSVIDEVMQIQKS